MKIIIVDSDREHGEFLKNRILAEQEKVRDVFLTNSVQIAHNRLKEQSTDLVFLCYNLCNKNSFSILRKFREACYEVVIMVENQAPKNTFKESSLEFVTKPVTGLAAIDILQKTQITILEEIFEASNSTSRSKKIRRIALKEHDGIRFIDIDQIKRCSSDNNYTEIYLENGQRILSTKTLKEHAKMLELHGFYRVHQSHLVDLKRIQKIVQRNGLFVQLKSEELVELSRRRKEELLKRLGAVEY